VLLLAAATFVIAFPWSRARLDLAAAALSYEVAAWAVAFGVTVFAYLAVSVAESPAVVRAAFRASVPAMWLVPAYVFLSGRALAETLGGLLLVANTVRLWLSGRAP